MVDLASVLWAHDSETPSENGFVGFTGFLKKIVRVALQWIGMSAGHGNPPYMT